MANGRGFLEELKRRHVWRVAIAYAVVAWLLLQLASIVLPTFGTPAWALKALIVVFVLCFPIALFLAWAYEMTPGGIRRTVSADSPTARLDPEHHSVGQKLNAIIIAVLVLAVALMGWHMHAMRQARNTAPSVAAAPHGSAAGGPDSTQHNPVNAAPASGAAAAKPPETAAATAGSGLQAAPAPIPARSIAVLPFENLSGDKNNAYFADGIQDLILTKLADIGDLKVISRTSTLQYGSHPENLKTVGQQLGVATILEGSVQKAGNQVLINVQLIDAKTDNHVWAKAYTKTLTNVFGVEGEVAEQVATALKAKLSPVQAEQLAAAPSANQAAMDLFLRAEYQANKSDTNYSVRNYSGWRAAIPLYRQAVRQDPTFALAWARLSFVESKLIFFTGEGGADLARQARADAEAAQKLAPHAVATLLALGYLDYYGEGDFAAALKTFKAALILRPNDSATLAAIGYVERKQNNYDAALASLQRAFTLDPRNSALAFEIGSTYMMVSDFSEAGNWYQRALAIDPNNLDAKTFYPQAVLYGSGDVVRALAAAGGDEPAMQLVRVSLLTYQRKYAEALTLLNAIPDTPDNFTLFTGNSKALQQAGLYRLLDQPAKARRLYRQALAALRPQLAKSLKVAQNGYLTGVWDGVANAELGLGQTKQGLAAIASAQVANAKLDASLPAVHANAMELNAGSYAQAHRPDLAVPLLAKALATPGIGGAYSPVLLWLDPAWDPIRHDPRFQALLKKYAKYKPSVTYPIPPASAVAAAPEAS